MYNPEMLDADRSSRGAPPTRREVLIPVSVGLAGMLISISVWALLVLDRHRQVESETRIVAKAIDEVLRAELESQADSLHSLAGIWRSSGDVGALQELTSELERLLRMHPGIRDIVAVDRESGRRALLSKRSDPTWLGELEALEPREEEEPDRGSRAAGGSTRFHVADSEEESGLYHLHVPAGPESPSPTVLIALFDPDRFLERTLQARAQPYAITVWSEGRTLYERGEPSRDPWQTWWRVEETLELTEGLAWNFVYRPTPEHAAARLTAVPHYALLLGLGLSGCLAFLVYELGQTRRQSRSLGVVNASLHERGRELLRLNEELEARVSARTQELEDAVVELRAFNYSVSHDLRSPLGAILNFASILREDYHGRTLDDEGVQILERIMRSARRATVLLGDLLELSKAGRADLEMEDVDMTRLARSAFRQAAIEEDTSDVELRIDPLPRVPCDPGLVGNVFVNFFTNALKYSRGCEKRRIHVTGTEEGGEAIFTISDNGRGFDMRFASKLFQVFERLHHDEEIEGTGVGLAIVARILKRHGGRVWASGAVGEGAVFSFALPLSRSPRQRSHRPGAADPRSPSA
ncbi:MAG TPA: ATP-binding protein [Myxococcota bacterium]|nr:ATP-binding protein [Myxococcota bacterium]